MRYLSETQTIRNIALQVLLESRKGYVQTILDKTIRSLNLSDPDRQLLTELVYGTIRWYGNLDWVIRNFIPEIKLRKLQPEIAEIIRLGLYQILFLDKVPDHAAVNESVELAKAYGNKGASGMVNAVLRNVIREKDNIVYPGIENPIKHISVVYSHPEWMVKRWLERYGLDNAIDLCNANNLRPSLCIRTNTLKTTRERLLKELEEESCVSASSNVPDSIGIVKLSSSIDKLQSYRNGLFYVQDEGAMLISHILSPQPDEYIIDACAAPGGKSTHIAELMRNKGSVLAIDIDNQRLELLQESCQRLGISIVEARRADAIDINTGRADRILVDAPCTGLGVLRRHAEIRWRRAPDQIRIFSETQYKILEGISKNLKIGGTLVYCTCTIEPEENIQVVERFLKSHTEFQIQNVKPFLPENLQEAGLVSEGYLQTYPHLHSMDSFFAARMIRTDR